MHGAPHLVRPGVREFERFLIEHGYSRTAARIIIGEGFRALVKKWESCPPDGQTPVAAPVITTTEPYPRDAEGPFKSLVERLNAPAARNGNERTCHHAD